jgi:hypothetical protein
MTLSGVPSRNLAGDPESFHPNHHPGQLTSRQKCETDTSTIRGRNVRDSTETSETHCIIAGAVDRKRTSFRVVERRIKLRA